MHKSIISFDFRHYARSRQSHIHDYAQVVLPLSGEMVVISGERTIRLGPSKAIIICPETHHDFESTQNGIFLVLDVEANGHGLSERSKYLLLGERNKSFNCTISSSHQRLIRFLSEEFYKSSGDLFRCQPLLDALISLVELAPEYELPHREKSMYWSCESFMTVRDKAAQLGLSESTFRRVIKKIHGESPKRLQMEERLSIAEQLLRTTNRPITSIALDLNFNNSSAFTNAFRRKFGISPSDFRLLLQQS